ncbi:putative Mg2+ transporter-C (MgtC) family protein [Psychrobacillus insolitus]|uniref:Putative Mg2+ transporter-C (MgtC) family protein n=1 Tax=Psychrobacillus insolitus TaxID=1461 RepID=A0A2W7MEP0_9BACI|nr:MgtC/SapB family protein [Psychrobacillus insolitus]PZX04755.1 putative Mg2+ transporter-C (MgtC) family protein [Psychrobacillus insolitus]
MIDWLQTYLENNEIIFKLCFAALLSLIIGIERELKKKPIGLKTSIVIATFSCLLTYISIESAYNTNPHNGINITMDPLRLAAQIVSGIGFLGVGVILHKGNDSITGLTTAAMIWGAGGIGIAVGAGFYKEASLTVAIVLIGIEAIPPLMTKFGPKRLRSKELFLKVLVQDTVSITKVYEYLEKNGAYIEGILIRDIILENDYAKHEMEMRLSILTNETPVEFYNTLKQLDFIERVEVESI